MIKIADLWYDIHTAVNSSGLFDDAILAALEQRCRVSRQEVVQWRSEYKLHCLKVGPVEDSSFERGLRRQLFGSAVETFAIINRLLATACDSHRQVLEVETQALARLSLELQKQPGPKYSAIFTCLEVSVINAVIETKDQWEEDLSGQDCATRRFAVHARYNTWNTMLRAS